MTTKEDELKRQLSVVNSHTERSSQFFNLNLNQKQKCSQDTVSYLSSFSKSNNEHNFGYNTVTDENAKTWNKKSKENSYFKTSKNPNLFAEIKEEKEEARKCWMKDSSEKSGSTLSLHIAAYENSVKVDSNKIEEESLTQKSKASKFVDFATKFQDKLEFPRQMDSIEQSQPQIMQFKASQKLFSPNQEFIPSFNNIFEEIFEQELMSVILWFLSIFLISAKLIFGCYYSRIRKRDAALFEQPRHIEAIPVNEAPENIDEARMRHEMLKWFPKLVLQPLSITESNFKSMRSKLKIKPHPKVETLPKFLPLDSNRKVTFSDTCLTFITYGEDLCRGESNGEKEENTQDIAPSPAASPATITTSSK